MKVLCVLAAVLLVVGANVPGGLFDVPIDDKVKGVAAIALARLTASSGGEGLQLVEITKAQKQVVAGQIYYLDLLLKDGESGDPKKCSLKVLYRFSDEPTSVEADCEDTKKYRARRQLGGVSAIESPEKDPQIQAYMTEALEFYNGSKFGQGHELAKITKATQQVVAGFITEINAVFSKGDLKKDCLVKVLDKIKGDKNEITVFCEGEEEIKNY